MARPVMPPATVPLSGTEKVSIFQEGERRILDMTNLPKRRMEVVSATVRTAKAISPAFKSAPIAIPINSVTGAQVTVPVVTALTASSITVDAVRSRGTLLLSSGPYEQAPAGVAVNVLLIGD